MKLTAMKSAIRVRAIFSLWMDSVAQTIADALERFASPQKVSLIEDEQGRLLLQAPGLEAGRNAPITTEQIAAGNLTANRPDLTSILRDSCVDVVLRPDHFLFRPLEFPKRASEFLAGIVRSQIERLMPWNTADTAYGWGQPIESNSDRMTITVAGTSVEVIRPLRQALAQVGVRSIRISVAPREPSAESISICEEKTRGRKQAHHIRRVLVAIIGAAGLSSVLAVASWGLIATKLESEQSRLAHAISETRSKAAKLGYAKLGEGKTEHTIHARKEDGPSAVLVIESLSNILPDKTYLTELRIEDGKLYLTGETDDAPSLIETLERSGRFAHATFFAPTTRSQNGARERFHIEAAITQTTWPNS